MLAVRGCTSGSTLVAHVLLFLVARTSATSLVGQVKMSQERRKAVAYLRTSSRTNVGVDKDSDKRQLLL